MNNREFIAPYEFREYPKWVTLADGSQVLVHNAEEETVAVGPLAEDDTTDTDADADADGSQVVDKAALLEEARTLGLDPHANTGAAKLSELIQQAKQAE